MASACKKLVIIISLGDFKNLQLSIFYVVFIWDFDLNKKRCRSSYGKIISKFHLLDLSKVSWKLLWGLNENRSSIHSLFLELKQLNLILSFRTISFNVVDLMVNNGNSWAVMWVTYASAESVPTLTQKNKSTWFKFDLHYEEKNLFGQLFLLFILLLL